MGSDVMKGNTAIVIYLIFSFSTAYSGTIKKDVRFAGLDKNCRSTLMLGDLAKKPKLHRTHGANFYTFPDKISNTYTGCQNVWLENGHKLVTKYYLYGEIAWVRGQQPKDVRPYFCVYKQKRLISKESFNVRRCPLKVN